jgi:hypothetical protein
MSTCYNQWKNVYCDGLSIPSSLIILVMVAHYVSCARVSSHTTTIITPFHVPDITNVTDIINVTIIAKPAKYPTDPLSVLYDSFMVPETLKEEAMDPTPEVTTPEIDNHIGMLQVCAMHVVSMGSFLALWLPTTYSSFSTKSSASWTIGSISICCCFTSWATCMVLYKFDAMRRLSLCLSMHLTMQFLYSQGFLAQSDPSVPMYMPVWVGRGMIVAQGILLCYIAHSGDSIAQYDTTQFYMNHVWAAVLAQATRQLVMVPIVLILGMTVSTKKKYD